MALRFGEYRESVDIDFLVSNLDGYRALRQLVTGPAGLASLAREGGAPMLRMLREVRADQYGIRTVVGTQYAAIKFEIVLEARIQLQAPGAGDEICGVHTLAPVDMAASKLLANSDRWLDDSVNCRDLIDLAMMQPPRALMAQAIAKAQVAYGDAIERDLRRAVERMGAQPELLGKCMRALAMTVPKALVWQRIKSLLPRAKRAV